MTDQLERPPEQEPSETVLARGTLYRRPDAAIVPELAGKDPEHTFLYNWAIDSFLRQRAEAEFPDSEPIGQYIRMRTRFEREGVQQEIDSNVMIMDRSRELINDLRASLSELYTTIQTKPSKQAKDELRPVASELEKSLERLKRNAELPPILVLPGYMGTGTMNEAAALAGTGRKVIVLSHPESPTTAIDGAKLKQWNSTDPYTQFYRQLIGDLKATLTGEGVDLGNDFDAVGWSAGAMMLTALAAEQDEGINIQNLALHNPAGFNRKHWLQVIAGAGGDIPRMISSGDSQAFREWLGPLVPPQHQVAPHENNEAGLEKLWQDLRNSTNGIRIAALVGRGLPDELLARLPNSTNLMILASERDRLFPLAEIQDRLSTREFEHVDYYEARDRGHMGIMTDELNGMILTRWLRKIRETGSRRATTS